MSYKIDVVIEKDEDGYYAYCPALKGCQTQGDTLEEVQANIKEAIELYLETLSEEERQILSKQEVLTMTLEVQVA
jgi:predicted RNase H-like HicB family nuclease